ncbi:MAG: sigma-70 family RNA polymerase sigma factor [Clostridia bacterium]|nr:sigma-70 family RNA polymerase sigma factor [Clostridia bacterium]
MQKEAHSHGAISEEELTRLVDTYSGILLGVCSLTLQDAALAQDIVQETFLKAWKKGGFRPESEKAWLIRVAMNLCHDYHRSRWWRHVDRSTPVEEMEIAQVGEREQEILLSVKALPFRERQIVILYFWNKMTLAEIGSMLGISASAAFRGLEKAKKLLKLEWEGG